MVPTSFQGWDYFWDCFVLRCSYIVVVSTLLLKPWLFFPSFFALISYLGFLLPWKDSSNTITLMEIGINLTWMQRHHVVLLLIITYQLHLFLWKEEGCSRVKRRIGASKRGNVTRLVCLIASLFLGNVGRMVVGTWKLWYIKCTR